MNKSQELKEKMNSLKSVQEDYFIDIERDKKIIEDTYGSIVEMTDDEFDSFLRKEAEKRGQKWK